jgi:glutamate-1-semialdehyde 2,1-aminomutase
MKHAVNKSWELAKAQRAHLACGSSTNSKRPQLEGDEPALIARGKGCRVWDVDGNEYIDFRGGLGPVSIGYAIPEINAAITAQLEDGVCFGQPHPLEGEVAGLLHEVIPCAEKARFLKTGGEAVAACVKIARGATGRDLVVHCGYNGWLSSIARPRGKVPVGIAASKPQNGIPAKLAELHLSLPWAVETEWKELFAARGSEIAAVVVACDYAEMDKAATFLPFLRDLTRKEGSLLVFDEIVTGFRLALGGAQERFKVTPDLAAVGKGVANGMPLSAYVGRADLMESSATLGISSTFGGEALALAAAKATLRFYREHDVISHLWKAGTDLWPRVQGMLDAHKIPGTITGAPVCPQLGFDTDARREAFFRAAYRNGLSLYDVSYVTWSHREADIRETLERFQRVVKELSTR